MANTSIQLKKSGVTGNVPASLTYGELAINYADGKLFYKAANGSIASISTGSLTNSFATVNSNNSLILATSATDTLTIIPGNNITISTDTVGKKITINSVSAGSAADQFARDTANNASANTIILQGINTTQNTRLNSIETINTNQNTSISIIQGVDNTQNTNITSVNQYAQSAYAKANSALANTSGAIFGGDLTVTGNLTASNIYGTLSNTTIVAGNFTTTFDTAGVITHTGNTAATSNATGALVVTGGIATKGNVYTGNIVITGITSNGITFADGTRQTTAASGTGLDSYARQTANAAFDKANTPWGYLANTSYTAILNSSGQFVLPNITTGGYTGGTMVSTQSFIMNAGGNLWVLDTLGNFISPYNVKITTTGLSFPDTSLQNKRKLVEPFPTLIRYNK